VIFYIKSLDNEIKQATKGLEIWVRCERQMMDTEFWFGTSCETFIFGLMWRLTLGWKSGTQVSTAGSERNWCSVAGGYAV